MLYEIKIENRSGRYCCYLTISSSFGNYIKFSKVIALGDTVLAEITSNKFRDA